MITENEKKIIQDIAHKYDASKVILFGSALADSDENHDIDIGVDGVADNEFFSFWGDLLISLSKPVDVVDLSQDTKFVKLILKEGVLLYA